MRLRSLRLSQIRRFREPLEITDFAPGLNLFTGPNEIGKSTIVRAIRAAFLERHRSTTLDDLIPRGETAGSASPTIRLEFEIDGTGHELTKTFFSRKRCVYRAGDRELDGDDAETALAELLGFGTPGRGPSKAEHWGIPGLLWIEQGEGHRIDEAVGHAKARLGGALESLVGAVASSEGDAVLKRLREQRNALLTAGSTSAAVRHRKGGELDLAATRLADLDARLAVLVAKIAEYRADVDRLDRLTRDQAREAEAKPWAVFGRQLDEARTALAAAEQLADDLKRQQDRQATAERTRQVFDDQLVAFAAERDRLGRDEAALADAAHAVERATAVVASRADERARASRRRAAAERAAAIAGRAAERRQAEADLARAADDEARLDGTVAEAARHQETLVGQRAEIAANRLDAAELGRLERSEQALRDAEVTERAAATTVRLALGADQPVTLDGTAVAATGEHRLGGPARLELAGVGAIEVVPGGGDSAGLARRVADARAARDAILARIGVASVDEAQARRRRLERAVAAEEAIAPLLAKLAPAGIDALRAALVAARQARIDAAARLGALIGGDSASDSGPEPASDALPSAASDTLPIDPAAARAAVATALADQQRVDEDYHAAARALAAAEATVASLAGAVADLKARLDDPAQRDREAEVARQQAVAATEARAAGDAVAALQGRITDNQPGLLRQNVQRLEQARDQARAAFDRRENELSALKGRLEAAGGLGLEDEAADLGVERAAVARRVDELTRRASALSLLVERLEAGAQAVRTRLQAPLQQRLDHYLRLLFPRGRLALNEDLTPGELVRDGADRVSFDQLSHGAREQAALISRLAYADLLAEAGRPTLIILDDALVHSDGERLEPMQRVLFDAATRHQILVFSCHPERWAALGVPARDVAELANRSAAASA